MTINYNINHNLLKLEIFNGLKGQERRALLIALSMIYHFTKYTGQCHFYQGQMSEDWDISARFFRSAINTLLDEKLIKVVRPYSRKEQKPAVYATTTGCIRLVSKLYPSGTKAVSPRDRVNNYVNNYKPQSDDFNQSSSVNGKDLPRNPAINKEMEATRHELLNNYNSKK